MTSFIVLLIKPPYYRRISWMIGIVYKWCHVRFLYVFTLTLTNALKIFDLSDHDIIYWRSPSLIKNQCKWVLWFFDKTFLFIKSDCQAFMFCRRRRWHSIRYVNSTQTRKSIVTKHLQISSKGSSINDVTVTIVQFTSITLTECLSVLKCIKCGKKHESTEKRGKTAPGFTIKSILIIT